MDGKPYSEAIRTYYNPLILAMRRLNKPIICRLNGIAAGAGCSLALACDIIVASEEAYLSELFIGIGLIMDSGLMDIFAPHCGKPESLRTGHHGHPRGRVPSYPLLGVGQRGGAARAAR